MALQKYNSTVEQELAYKGEEAEALVEFTNFEWKEIIHQDSHCEFQ
jgi:hypothetical protein